MHLHLPGRRAQRELATVDLHAVQTPYGELSQVEAQGGLRNRRALHRKRHPFRVHGLPLIGGQAQLYIAVEKRHIRELNRPRRAVGRL